MFADKIQWWEELDYSLGVCLFAHMLSKPFLCSCFVMACLSFPSPCMWRSSKGNQVGKPVWDSLDCTCIPVLNIMLAGSRRVSSQPRDRLSNSLFGCALLSSLFRYSSSSFPLNTVHNVKAKANALILLVLWKLSKSNVYVTFIWNLNSTRFTQMFSQHCSNVLATSYWTSRL